MHLKVNHWYCASWPLDTSVDFSHTQGSFLMCPCLSWSEKQHCCAAVTKCPSDSLTAEGSRPESGVTFNNHVTLVFSHSEQFQSFLTLIIVTLESHRLAILWNFPHLCLPHFLMIRFRLCVFTGILRKWYYALLTMSVSGIWLGLVPCVGASPRANLESLISSRDSRVLNIELWSPRFLIGKGYKVVSKEESQASFQESLNSSSMKRGNTGSSLQSQCRVFIGGRSCKNSA